MSQKLDPHRDLYADLGVTSKATSDEIKSAYRKLAFELHPDKTNGDTGKQARFIEASKAHSILSNEKLKEEYDTLRDLINRPPSRDRFTPFDFGFHFSGDLGSVRMNPVYASRVTMDPTEQGPIIEGEDIEIELSLDLEDAIRGCNKPITLKSGALVPCSDCKGSGADPKSERVMCNECVGTGKKILFNSQNHGKRTYVCTACKGIGSIPLTQCKRCSGKGKMPNEKELNVQVPAGVTDGDKLRIAGQGTPGINSAPGDLFVTIRVKEHPSYTKKGLDLYTICRVPLLQALKGGSLEFEHIDGKVLKLRIPGPITPGKSRTTLKGKGITHPSRKVSGDLHLQFEVAFPKEMSPKAQELIEQLGVELQIEKLEAATE
jgi:molecular chaperone DnaJ